MMFVVEYVGGELEILLLGEFKLFLGCWSVRFSDFED